MRVRPMRVGEGSRVRELRLRALADAPEAFAATVAEDAALPAGEWEALAGGPGVVFVAEDFSGMAAVYLPDDQDPRVWGTWVAPERRGSGLAGELMRAVVYWARVRALPRLTLTVTEAAPAAAALYARFGFVRTGPADPLPSHPELAVHAMALELPREPRRVQTQRLVLREFEHGDLEALHAILSREDVVRHLYPPPASEEEVRRRLARRIPRVRFARSDDGLGFAAVRRDTGRMIGDCSLTLTAAEHHQGEIGFVFHPDHHGRGYATEAARALLALGFETFGLHRIAGRLEARNAASARVLERLGMRREAHLVENEIVKGEWQSELVYALRASEWPTASRGGGSTPPSRPAARP